MLIEPKGRPHIACPKCTQNVVWPEVLSLEEKQKIAAISRRDRLEAVHFVEATYRLDTREAKALSLHVSRVPDECHRCGSSISGAEAICATCRSANLNWLGSEAHAELHPACAALRLQKT